MMNATLLMWLEIMWLISFRAMDVQAEFADALNLEIDKAKERFGAKP